MIPPVRSVLDAVCAMTIVASTWLGVMFLVLHHPGFERGAAMAALFVLQSLLTLAVTNAWVSSSRWRLASGAGAAALTWTGATAVAKTLGGTHFEGYALIIGLLLILQGLLALAHLLTSTLTSSSKVHPFGN